MAEGLLNVPPRELGFNQLADSRCPGFAVPAERGPNSPLHFAGPSLAKLTSPAEHRAVAYEAPRLCRDPLIPSPLFGFGFEAREF